MTIVELAPEHATAAAHLHLAGQSGTFLTELGPGVLTVFYRALPRSAAGFGFAAWSGQPDQVIGFVSATTNTGQLFLEMATRHLGELLPVTLARCLRHPILLWHSAQTLAYPLLTREPGEKGAAELLSIMVAPAWRGQGIGTRLLEALVGECGRRGLTTLDVMVDAANQGAQRFYRRHHFVERRQISLYGRALCLYRRELPQAHPGGQ
ncbi:GNAT family N-acetyltransferase [Litorilinea aerophila]|uniref:GNAT family N-acetyltransferase n=1 Tax=Litorilinea aerophila TaxID=1204385 RepID=A0A540V8Y2_9CHLR|nr:GNAT family N-acetyltransferase [Litorilinea aerophila]MCC9078903.1 GNAT family N-acetyltransferase [Litorilinea aerophila]GIV76041.1 MAG: hypothetical protein KatS3mg050_0435 [Litorilinea sp.]